MVNQPRDKVDTCYWTVACDVSPRFVAKATSEWVPHPKETLRLEMAIEEIEWVDDEPNDESSSKLVRDACRSLAEMIYCGMWLAVDGTLPEAALEEVSDSGGAVLH